MDGQFGVEALTVSTVAKVHCSLVAQLLQCTVEFTCMHDKFSAEGRILFKEQHEAVNWQRPVGIDHAVRSKEAIDRLNGTKAAATGATLLTPDSVCSFVASA